MTSESEILFGARVAERLSSKVSKVYVRPKVICRCGRPKYNSSKVCRVCFSRKGTSLAHSFSYNNRRRVR